MRGLATFLEVVGLALLIAEAIGERRAPRWKHEIEEGNEAMDALLSDRLGRGFGRGWPRFYSFVGLGLVSAIARFDGWKDRHGLSDLVFLLALACAVSGVALSVAFS